MPTSATRPPVEWHVITCEYPPHLGGVSDYTRLVAAGLAERGDRVHVWAPSIVGARPSDDGVVLHDEAGSFSRADLRRLDDALDRFSGPRRLLVQWVPHGYGYWSMNVGFCLWLLRRARRSGDRVEIMLHEPFLSFQRGSIRANVAALVHRLMTVILLRAASRVWHPTTAWERRWRPFALGRPVVFEWLPVPSNIPTEVESTSVTAARNRYARAGGALLGHFGTFGETIRRLALDVLASLPGEAPSYDVLLIGPGSEDAAAALLRRRPDLSGRVHATGPLPARGVAECIAACDVMLQPYPDGVSSRRGSFMAALALGRPIVTTLGFLSEQFWNGTGAAVFTPATDIATMAAETARLLSDGDARRRIGEAGRKLYCERFDLSHTIDTLHASH